MEQTQRSRSGLRQQAGRPGTGEYGTDDGGGWGPEPRCWVRKRQDSARRFSFVVWLAESALNRELFSSIFRFILLEQFHTVFF